jgi:hypothetical protein
VRAIFLALGLVVLLAGCGRQSTARETSPAATNAAGASSEAQIKATLGELTQLVRRYAMEQRSTPQTMQELVDKGYIAAVPPAPAGKKFAINKRLEVYLAKP